MAADTGSVTASPAERPGNRLSVIKNRPLLTLTLGHMTIDSYVGLIPVLYPLLIDRFELGLASVGLVSLAYTGTSSLSQPFFGWIADKYGTRFTGITLIWTALTFASIGFAPTFGALLALAALSGLGSGAFHPLGAVNASAVIPDGQRNTAMSFYVTGGTLGVASGPIVGALLFRSFGVQGTALMILPGLSIALWLLFEMRKIAVRHDRLGTGVGAPPIVPAALRTLPWGVLSVIVGVMMLRMWTVFGIQAFIPTWYRELGYSEAFYGPLATVVTLGAAVGAIGSGTLADRFGRRRVILISLILTTPAILVFSFVTGPSAFLTGAVIGLLAASTGPLLLVMAQQLMRGRAGMASGVILGLGFVAGGIGVPVMGALADHIGIAAAMRAQIIVVLLTFALAWRLPSERRVRELMDAGHEPKAVRLQSSANSR